jgi:hypothetical protein
MTKTMKVEGPMHVVCECEKCKGTSMTQEDIIRMAREAGLDPDLWNYTNAFERFAALVAASEREACAKVCEPSEEHRRDAAWGYLGGEEGVQLLDAKAADIRARGQA